jgi:hypothetical protein
MPFASILDVVAATLNELQRVLAEQQDGPAIPHTRNGVLHHLAELGPNLEKLRDAVVALLHETETAREEAATLRRTAQEQADRLRELTQELRSREAVIAELRRMLLETHEQLLYRDEDLQASLLHALQWAGRDASAALLAPQGKPAQPAPAKAAPAEASPRLYYEQVIRHIREVVGRSLPAPATVAVVSKGDEELLKLDARQGWHFPRGENGIYAGYYPADSAAAIAHLEELREKGAHYLLFPQQAFWWFDSYADFGRHLKTRYHCVYQDAHCRIYHLREAPHGRLKRLWQWLSAKPVKPR